MFDPDNLASDRSDLEKLLGLIGLVTDIKASKSRAEELIGLATAAIEREAAAKSAEASLATARAEQEAAMAKRSQELDAYAEAIQQREYELERHQATMMRGLEIARALELQVSRALMSHHDILPGFDDRLQSMPDLKSVLDYIERGKRDAHVDPAQGDHGRGEHDAAFEDGPAPDLPAGSTLTRSVPRSMRRGVPRV